MKKKLVAFLVSSSLVLSAAFSSYAAAYDFIRKSDNKIFSILDVATDPDVLLDIATDDTGFMVELKDGKKYDLAAYKAIVTANPGISEDDVIAKLNKETELKVVSVSAITKEKLLVKLSKEVDAAAAENFKVTVGEETKKVLSVTADETDKKQLIVEVEGLLYNSTAKIIIDGLKSGSFTLPTYEKEITIPAIGEFFQLVIKPDLETRIFKKEFQDETPYYFMVGEIDQTTMVHVTVQNRFTGEVATNVKGTIHFIQPELGKLKTNDVHLTDGKVSVPMDASAVTTVTKDSLRARIMNAPQPEYNGIEGAATIVFGPRGAGESSVSYLQIGQAFTQTADRVTVEFKAPIHVNDLFSAYAKKAEELKEFDKHFETLKTRALNAGAFLVDGQKPIDIIQEKDHDNRFILILDSDNGKPATRPNKPTYETLKKGSAVLANPYYLEEDAYHEVTVAQNITSQKLNEKGEMTKGIGILSGKAEFKFSDNIQPQAIDFQTENPASDTVRIVFSEPMAEDSVEEMEIVDTHLISKHFTIDGRKLLVSKTPGSPKKAERQYAKAHNMIVATQLFVGEDKETERAYEASYEEGKAAEDKRHIVTIVIDPLSNLEKDTDYALQAINVADGAGRMDAWNVIASQVGKVRFDLKVTEGGWDASLQSPEQYLIRFTEEVSPKTGKKVEDVFKLSIKKGAEETFLDYGTDYEVRKVNVDKFTAPIASAIAKGAAPDAGQHYLLEMKKDWTKYYDTDTNKVNYYTSKNQPLNITIEGFEDSFDKEIPKKTKEFTLTHDVASPTLVDEKCGDVFNKDEHKINGFTATGTGQAFYVKTNEPVKLNLSSEAPPYTPSEGLTPSQKEDTSGGVNVPTFEFDQEGKVIKGELVPGSVDEDDMSFVIKPKEKLTPGKWTVKIMNLTDDVGNGAATRIFEIEIKEEKAPQTDFQILWAAFDNHDTTGGVDPTYDYLYIKFSKKVKAEADENTLGASDKANYALGTQQINEIDAQVLKGIKGITDDWDGLTIQMDKNVWNGGAPSKPNDFHRFLSIHPSLRSIDGDALPADQRHLLLADTNNDLPTREQDMAFEAIWSSYKNTFEKIEMHDEDHDGKVDKLSVPVGGMALPDATFSVGGVEFKHHSGSEYKPLPAEKANVPVGTSPESVSIQGSGDTLVFKVVDKASPIITKAVLSEDKQTMDLTFSEKVDKANGGPFVSLQSGDFTPTFAGGAAIFAVAEHNEATAEKAVLNITSGTGIEKGNTIKFGSGFDFAGNAAHDTAAEVEGGKVVTGATINNGAEVNHVDGAAAKLDVTVTTIPDQGAGILHVGNKKIGFKLLDSSPDLASADHTISLETNNNAQKVADAIEAYLDGAGGNVTKKDGAVSDANIELQAAEAGVEGNGLQVYYVKGDNADAVAMTAGGSTIVNNVGTDTNKEALAGGVTEVKEKFKITVTTAPSAATGQMLVKMNPITGNAALAFEFVLPVEKDQTEADVAKKLHELITEHKAKLLGIWVVEDYVVGTDYVELEATVAGEVDNPSFTAADY